MMKAHKWRRMVSPVVVAVMLLAACSSDDGGTSSDSTAADTAAPDTAAPDTAAPDTEAAPDTTEAESDTTEAESDTTDAPAEGDQVVIDGINMAGTGPSPDGAGLLSQAAIDSDTCNPNGRTTFNVAGGGPFCVNPWSAGDDNGGATAPGVTATEVKVVVYVPNADMVAAGTGGAPPTNQATGEVASAADAVADGLEIYEYATENFETFQLWGRTPVVEIVEASGTDEAAQRADALAVIDKQPFMVIDLTATAAGGAPFFSAAVSAQDIVVASSSTNSTNGAEQSPYLWNYGSDPDASGVLAAAFLGKTLSGGIAEYAGDESMTSQPRSFGAIYPASAFDLGRFTDALAENGGDELTEAVEFDPADAAQIGEQAPTMINRLKASGVTSVVLFADNSVITPLLAAATAQDYNPEWIFTGFAYQDFGGFARGYDQEQMRHAFGLSGLYPYIDTGEEYDYLTLFTWYWGTQAGNNWGITTGATDWMYRALHYAGPNLTAETLKQGLFSAPANGGAATGTVTFQTGYGNTTGMPYEEYAQLGTDVAFMWWNADLDGPSQVIGIPGVGNFMYLDNGKRYSYSSLPDEAPTFFDEANSVVQVDVTTQFPAG